MVDEEIAISYSKSMNVIGPVNRWSFLCSDITYNKYNKKACAFF